MKVNESNEKITISLEGRINTNNAEQWEKDITEVVAAHPGAKVEFDAEDLEYISSAGLRVLMRVRKSVGEKMDIQNVSADIYNIFMTTGFNELYNLKKKIREISVDGCPLIGAGGFGKVYRIDEETIAKIYNEGVPREFVESEKESSKNAFILGIPTAISYDVIKCGNSYGTVYEMLNARTVAQIIDEDPTKLQQMAYMMASKLKEFHQIEVPESSGFEDKKDGLKKWVDKMEPVLTAEEIQKIRDFIDSIPDRRTFLHGDYNSKNIMVQNGELQLIDVGDAAYGHPVFDVAMLMLAYIILPNSPGRKDEMRRSLLGFDPALAQNVWGVMCGTYFGIQSPEEIGSITQRMMPLVYLYIAYQGVASGRSTPEILADKVVRPQLIPLLDAGVNLPLDF
ncbi:TIGR02172 family protein [Lachnospiraceae bacterium NE2001]|nr:TIGR02172 family protein [Lachnospiraceae bacterium NE2001]